MLDRFENNKLGMEISHFRESVVSAFCPMSFRCGHAVSQEPILQEIFCGIIPPFCKLDRRDTKNVSNYEWKGLLRASTFIEIAPGLWG